MSALVLGAGTSARLAEAATPPSEAALLAEELLSERSNGDIVVVTETSGVPSFKVVKHIDSVTEAETAIEGVLRSKGSQTTLADADWQETGTLTASVTGPLTQWPVGTLGLSSAWSMSAGSGVVVAVVDTGVAPHPDIPRLLPGFSTVGGTVTAGQSDNVGHGTHVAGTIAAGADGIGVTGVAYGASILPIKAFASGTAPTSDVAAGIVQAVEAGADVINMSFGFSSSNAAITAAIDYAAARGVVLVGASGNSADTVVHWPAADPRVLAVGATQEDGSKTGFSNTGPELDLVAPGRNVISTVVANAFTPGLGGIKDGSFSYGYASGTSMATPHVAGVAALVLGRHPEATRSEVMSFLTSTATDKGEAGFDTSYGFGLVNPVAAMAASDLVYGTPTNVPGVIGTPGAPTGLNAVAGNKQAALSWNAPAADGGSIITDYVIEYSSNAGAGWVTFNDAVSATPNVTVTGLVNGTSYTFRVSALNSAGSGPASDASTTATPFTIPGAPGGLGAVSGDGETRLYWIAAAANGSTITDYRVEYDDGWGWRIFEDGVTSATSATVTGLVNGINYNFRVTAINAAGAGPSSEQTTNSPYGVPGTPSDVFAFAQNAQVVLSWTAPAANGSPLTRYRVEYNSGPGWVTYAEVPSTTTHTTVTGLINGITYDFRVSASNAAGWGAAATGPDNSATPQAPATTTTTTSTTVAPVTATTIAPTTTTPPPVTTTSTTVPPTTVAPVTATTIAPTPPPVTTTSTTVPPSIKLSSVVVKGENIEVSVHDVRDGMTVQLLLDNQVISSGQSPVLIHAGGALHAASRVYLLRALTTGGTLVSEQTITFLVTPPARPIILPSGPRPKKRELRIRIGPGTQTIEILRGGRTSRLVRVTGGDMGSVISIAISGPTARYRARSTTVNGTTSWSTEVRR